MTWPRFYGPRSMTLPCRFVCALALALATLVASAAEAEAPGVTPTKPEPGVIKPFESHWEGAIGPLLSYAPDYSGAGARRVSVTPGFYLRYGRFSVSNASGFVTRRNKDDIFRGLGVDLVRAERLRLGLALRLDNGRRSSNSSALAGISDVRRTLRMRANASWQFDRGIKLSSGLSTDLLGHGGGNVLDLGLSLDRRFSPSTTWSIGTGIAWADRRYMTSYYGVTPANALTSGYPAYAPSAGPRDASVGVGWRTEIGNRWIVLGGASVGRLLGPAARSPLTHSARQWGMSGGVAWLF